MANPKGGVTAQKIDADDAYNRRVNRHEDLLRVAIDVWPGPLEDRGAKIVADTDK